MSKYDFDLDLSQNTSTGIILGFIGQGSRVLEFGCAEGRMTRYMKESLGCRVDIVEYDPEAYGKAIPFAAQGLCDDIMNFRWTEQFAKERYDAILFADVLEHLPDPESAVTRAATLLKPDGRIYISVPNITHNDVVLKACEEHFDYTPVGLLDDTHCHFWGFANLEPMAQRCGLHLETVRGTYCPTGCTEQYVGTDSSASPLLRNILRDRKYGEVYQFVLILAPGGAGEPACEFRTPSLQSRLYLDTGCGFHEEEPLTVLSESRGRGIFAAHCEIPTNGTVQRVRFDPIDGQNCLLRSAVLCQDGAEIPVVIPGAVSTGKGTLLMGGDPMIWAAVNPQGGSVALNVEFAIPGEAYLDALEKGCIGLDGECDALRRDGEEMTRKNRELTRRVSRLSREKDELAGKLDAAVQKNSQYEVDLGAYILLTNKKEEYILSLEGELDRYRNLWFVRCYDKLRRLWHKLKSRRNRAG